jgi:beta-lactamase class A
VELLVNDVTGGPYIRSGVPAGWKVGDKTGNGDYGTRNDVAIVWPPHHKPIVIALFSHRGAPDSTSQDALLADATKVVVANISSTS